MWQCLETLYTGKCKHYTPRVSLPEVSLVHKVTWEVDVEEVVSEQGTIVGVHFRAESGVALSTAVVCVHVLPINTHTQHSVRTEVMQYRACEINASYVHNEFTRQLIW